MEQTKIRLMLDYPFFGSLALSMPLIEDSSTTTTIMTNGKEIRYNAEFIETLTSANKLFVYLHEICHVILGHSVRRGSRKVEPWNIACDYAVNLLIHESTNVVRPPGALFDRDYTGWLAEQIYEKISDDFQDEIAYREDNSPEDDDLSEYNQDSQVTYDTMVESSETWGEVVDSRPEDNVSEEEIRSAVALMVRLLTATGEPPSGRIRDLVSTFIETKIRWQDLLSKFMCESCANKYSWTVPNRRYQGGGGVMLPNLTTNDSLTIAVVMDTSDSVDTELLSRFAEEFKVLIESISYSKVIVMSCSDRVHNPRTFIKGEEVIFIPEGSGQTLFAPAFEYIAEMDENPSCIIYFTDLFSDTFGNQPWCPVLWIGKYSEQWEKAHVERVPFGEIINMG